MQHFGRDSLWVVESENPHRIQERATTMNAAVLHHYRYFRAHQLRTWDRRDNSGGGAWPGEHASCAFQSARAHLNFMKRMEAYCAPKKRRAKKR